MYTLEGVSSVANFITVYESVSIKPRLPFSNPLCVLCFQRESFSRLYITRETTLETLLIFMHTKTF